MVVGLVVLSNVEGYIGISFQYFLIQLINEFEKVHMSKAKGQQYQENQHILFHFG